MCKVSVLCQAEFLKLVSESCRVFKCPTADCTGTFTASKFYNGKPSGPMHCTVCASTFQLCTSGKACHGGAEGMLSEQNFAVRSDRKRRAKCSACISAELAPEAAERSCLGTLTDPCPLNGRCKEPADTCSACAVHYRHQVTAIYSFLRPSLLAEVADGGQKLSFVPLASPLRTVVEDKQNFFPKKDIAFVFGMQSPQATRQLAASLQQKYEDAGGRSANPVASGKSTKKALPANRMFWEAPVPDFKNSFAHTGGKDPWCKGLQGSYYLQRLQVIKLSNPTAFNYNQHLSSLQRVFCNPDNYIMQGPRESYNESFGGYHYKFTSIYHLPMSATTKKTDGVMLHESKLQRVFSIKACPTDELLIRTLRKQ